MSPRDLIRPARKKPVYCYARERWFDNIEALDEVVANCPQEQRIRAWEEQQRAEAQSRKLISRIKRWFGRG